MNMRELRWKYLRPTDLTGKPYAVLCRWIEDLVRALFPESGIEYWADPTRLGQARPGELTPKDGKPDWVSNILSTVYHGRNEGRHIDVGLKLRDGTVKQITWAKSFGSGDECWAIARAVAEALELIFNYEEQPEIVDMYRKVATDNRWLGPIKLAGGVTVERTQDCVSVLQADKKLLDSRRFGGRVDVRLVMMDAYQADWLTLLRAHNVPVSIKVIGPKSAADVRPRLLSAS